MHAKWRRARSEELAISLRRVVEPTITRPAFEHWRRKVSNIFLARRVVSAAVDAWRRRLAKPAYASDFYCCWDSFHAWRSLARERRDARRRRQTAVEYHRVSLALKRFASYAAPRAPPRPTPPPPPPPPPSTTRARASTRPSRPRRVARRGPVAAADSRGASRRDFADSRETSSPRGARPRARAVITRTARRSPIRDVRDRFPVRGVPWRPCSPRRACASPSRRVDVPSAPNCNHLCPRAFTHARARHRGNERVSSARETVSNAFVASARR